MTRLYAAALVAGELLWTYAALVAVSEWGYLGWDGPPVTLWAAVVLAAGALAPSLLAESAPALAVRVRHVALPAQALLLAVVLRWQLGGGYAPLDTAWFSAVWVNGPSVLVAAASYGAFLLWRGVSCTTPLPPPERVHARFIIGLALLFFSLLFAFFSDEPNDNRRPLLSLGVYGVTFFALGMAAIALANLREIRRELSRRADIGLPSLQEWMAVPAATIVGMLLVALVFSAIFSFDVAALLLIPITYAAMGVAYALLYGVIWPLSFIAGGLTWLLTRLGGVVEPEDPSTSPALIEDEPLLLEQGETVLFSDTAIMVLQWGVAVLAVALVILILARALGRFRRSGGDDNVVEVSESLGAWRQFRDDLRMFLGWLVGLVRRRARRVDEPAAAPASVAEDPAELREFTIREIYQGLLWEGREAGRPRRRAETPYEYRARLAPLAGADVDALAAITQAYVEARYGAQPPAPQRLHALNTLWRALRAAIPRRGEE